MNQERIKALLKKYENANCTPEEEQELKTFFENEEIEDELVADYRYFHSLTQIQDDLLSIDQINELIDQSLELTGKSEKNVRIKYNRNLLSGIAASILLIFGLFFLYRNSNVNQSREIGWNDTYQDPEIAYLEAKKALLFVSEKMNTGKDEIQKISKFEDGIDYLDEVSRMGEEMEKLKLVSKMMKQKK